MNIWLVFGLLLLGIAFTLLMPPAWPPIAALIAGACGALGVVAVSIGVHLMLEDE
jgi:hypothetical protein